MQDNVSRINHAKIILTTVISNIIDMEREIYFSPQRGKKYYVIHSRFSELRKLKLVL